MKDKIKKWDLKDLINPKKFQSPIDLGKFKKDFLLSLMESMLLIRLAEEKIAEKREKGEIGGPVKIAEISGRVAQQGLIPFALLVAVISINLGLVNLLPIPPLDGGHLLFFGLEGVMGKPVPPKLQELVMRVGMSLLLTLIVILTFFDGANTMNAQC